MRYALLIYTDDELRQRELGDEFGAQEMEAYGTYTNGLVQRGLMRGGEALQGTTTATTVRIRKGQRLVTDGPFAETKEALGGFYIVEAKDLDEAIDIAAQCPGARSGAMEVRPIMELPAEYQQQAPQAQTAGATG
jgi:hypothetical protein